MFEYYGWISVPLQGHPNFAHQLEELPILKDMVAALSTPARIAEQRVINGNFVACFAGLPNHWSKIADGVIELFKDIEQRYAGAYGVLSYKDSERNDETFTIFEIGTQRILKE